MSENLRKYILCLAEDSLLARNWARPALRAEKSAVGRSGCMTREFFQTFPGEADNILCTVLHLFSQIPTAHLERFVLPKTAIARKKPVLQLPALPVPESLCLLKYIVSYC